MQCTYFKRMMPSIFVFRNVQREMWFQDQYHDRDLNKLMTFVAIMGLLDVFDIIYNELIYLVKYSTP